MEQMCEAMSRADGLSDFTPGPVPGTAADISDAAAAAATSATEVFSVELPAHVDSGSQIRARRTPCARHCARCVSDPGLARAAHHGFMAVRVPKAPSRPAAAAVPSSPVRLHPTNILNGILEVAQAVEGAAAITATAVSIMGTLNAQTYAATAAGSAVLASRV